ncbi:hypothetical protein P7228_05790 [Altererythrobacter arenosus]|uniref:Uncharacterized protein n=1 Tax=Altererythrobacter arenosus TaxID=3032592 RepID=A0ABY8FWZ0_9SPHN|nr:hypothetical protein [Altererythrobacter sp. CAU 1644]WFL78575.1 hypothetical protein P7228_05790 [Altererythrobacter sp. CAU 1644]
MSAMEHHDQFRAANAIPANRRGASKPLAERWRYLHEAANEIADKAALAPEIMSVEIEGFPHRVETAGADRAFLVRRALEDLDAVLQPGLTALRLIESRGLDTTAPALALWREFYHTRAAVLSLCPSSTREVSTPDPA